MLVICSSQKLATINSQRNYCSWWLGIFMVLISSNLVNCLPRCKQKQRSRSDYHFSIWHKAASSFPGSSLETRMIKLMPSCPRLEWDLNCHISMSFETWAIFQELVRVFIKELDTKNNRISAIIDTSSVTEANIFSQGLLLLVVAIPVLILDRCGLSHHYTSWQEKLKIFCLFWTGQETACQTDSYRKFQWHTTEETLPRWKACGLHWGRSMKFSLEIIYGHGKFGGIQNWMRQIGSGIECKGFILSPSPLAPQ